MPLSLHSPNTIVISFRSISQKQNGYEIQKVQPLFGDAQLTFVCARRRGRGALREKLAPQALMTNHYPVVHSLVLLSYFQSLSIITFNKAYILSQKHLFENICQQRSTVVYSFSLPPNTEPREPQTRNQTKWKLHSQCLAYAQVIPSSVQNSILIQRSFAFLLLP